MPCEAEERTVAKMRQRLREAERYTQLEKTAAELDVLQSDKRVYDRGALRIATARMRCWDRRLAKAEEALKRCQEKQKPQHD